MQILLKACWGAGGWKSGDVSRADFEYARARGLMFDPLTVTHDAPVIRTIKIRDTLNTNDLARAFLGSLSTRKYLPRIC